MAIGSCIEDCEVSAVANSIGAVSKREMVDSVAAAGWVGEIDF